MSPLFFNVATSDVIEAITIHNVPVMTFMYADDKVVSYSNKEHSIDYRSGRKTTISQ